MNAIRSAVFPKRFQWLLVLAAILACAVPATAAAQRVLSKGQSLYLPIYAFIQYGDLDRSGIARQMPVSALVSVHNTDPERSLRLLSANYYATDGKFLRNFVASPRLLKPMETLELLVERRDVIGGSGANFVIQWDSDVPMSPPLVQALHGDVQANRAIAFTTDAVVIPR